ncbi:hypothetical protein evm_014035 [Chilo suppressalis]|nr:hypothetical protein evm_014035 [Chilo suppressalis]
MKGVTDKIGRILKRASINTYFKPPKKINQFLRPVKCNIPFQVAGVYKLECDCGLSYIGQTKRSIGTRVKEHIADMKHRRENKSAVCEHALGGPNHYIRFDRPQILAAERRFVPRMMREAIEIKKYPNFNREDGGCLIMAVNSLIYLNQSVPPYGVSLNSVATHTTNFPLRIQEGVCITLDGSCVAALGAGRFALSLKGGQLYVLTLLSDSVRSVRSFHLDRAAASVLTTTITKDGKVVIQGQKSQFHQVNIPGKGIQYIKLVSNQNPSAAKTVTKLQSSSSNTKSFVISDNKGKLVQVSAAPPPLVFSAADKRPQKLVRIAAAPLTVKATSVAQASGRSAQSLLAPLTSAEEVVDPAPAPVTVTAPSIITSQPDNDVTQVGKRVNSPPDGKRPWLKDTIDIRISLVRYTVLYEVQPPQIKTLYYIAP